MSTDVEVALRRALIDRAEGLPGHPDPWQRFSRLESRHRVARRARIGGVAVAGVAAVGLVGSGVVPVPSWVPAITIAPSSSPLLDQPTVGQLAADTAWIEEFRSRVPALLAETWASDSDGHWKLTSPDDVRVLYAGDVEGQRMVLAVFPLRLGLIQAETSAWFTGPIGATPAQMQEDGTGDVGRVGSRFSASAGRAWVLAVAPTGSTLEVSAPPVVTADGRIEQRWVPMTRLGTGEFVTDQAAPLPTLRLTQADGTVTEELVGLGQGDQAGWDDLPTDLVDSVAPQDPALPSLGDEDRHTLLGPVAAELGQLGVDSDTADVTLVWYGRVEDGWQALTRVHVKDGGVLVIATRSGATEVTDDVSTTPVSTDLVAVAPAAVAATRPYAWRLLGSDGEPSSAVTVVAPAETARLELAVEGQPAVDLDVTAAGYASTTVPVTASAEVLAYGSDGDLMGRTPVVTFVGSGDPVDLPRLGAAR